MVAPDVEIDDGKGKTTHLSLCCRANQSQVDGWSVTFGTLPLHCTKSHRPPIKDGVPIILLLSSVPLMGGLLRLVLSLFTVRNVTDHPSRTVYQSSCCCL